MSTENDEILYAIHRAEDAAIRIQSILSESLRLLADRTNHRGCEDGWYACPLSPDYIQHVFPAI